MLVLQDLLGLTSGQAPRFVRPFMNGRKQVLEALEAFAEDVREGGFPAPAERYAG